MKSDLLVRTNILMSPDPAKVIMRFFSPDIKERIPKIIARIIALENKAVEHELDHIMHHFKERHYDVRSVLLKHYDYVKPHMITDLDPSEEKRLLIGAYFTSEYSLESAALFNPSIVPHPDQSGVKSGSLRFIMSLRAIGEGHISSIVFRSGIINENYNITVDEPGRCMTGPESLHNQSYEKNCFSLKLYEMGFENEFSSVILDTLGADFTFDELREGIKKIKASHQRQSSLFTETLLAMTSLAESNYETQFSPELDLSERVVFPYAATERQGMEDARFVRFCDEESGKTTYYATYTAFDGNTILPQLLETKDFCKFKFITLNGKAVQNKGMALFPRKINGLYAMLSRQDNENIFIMYSNNIHFWHDAKMIMKPTYPWGFIQLGNCGSPIETEHGWLVLTHHVGAMRRYSIGAVLLDKEDPSKVIGRLKEPLLEPDENEREGYVPNVVYTCGAIIHKDKLVMPYAMSDYATTIALVDLDCLMKKMMSG
ncbi:MAG: glycoside hydrolase family 130 protein [Thermodesulfobacteriota bacterium]